MSLIAYSNKKSNNWTNIQAKRCMFITFHETHQWRVCEQLRSGHGMSQIGHHISA